MSRIAGQKIITNKSKCIQCNQCNNACPTETLDYSTKFLDWKNNKFNG
ncbi:MAG: 4Fe-4S dicluster domain-containing protein [Sedimentibacter sp.]